MKFFYLNPLVFSLHYHFIDGVFSDRVLDWAVTLRLAWSIACNQLLARCVIRTTQPSIPMRWQMISSRGVCKNRRPDVTDCCSSVSASGTAGLVVY